jgi:hypothetical protein
MKNEKRESEIITIIEELLYIKEQKKLVILQQKYDYAIRLRDSERNLEFKLFSVVNNIPLLRDGKIKYSIEADKILMDRFGFVPESRQQVIQILRMNKLDNILNNNK